nr:putative amino-acid permease c15c4.04c [Quercus suber]
MGRYEVPPTVHASFEGAAESNDKGYEHPYDKRDMQRLGKQQELKRRFRFASIVGYTVILGLTWEFSLVTGVFSLANGGTAGAIWLTLIVCCGMMMCVLSMAELASMAPTSGGESAFIQIYYLEFAPTAAQKPLSYAVGWLCALGWQCRYPFSNDSLTFTDAHVKAAMPTVAYIGAQQVLALIVVCNPSFKIQGWHGALLTIAFVVTAITFNTFGISKLPLLELVAVALHVSGFIAVVVILWTLGPRAAASDTFTTFDDVSGWGSLGLATLIGMVGPATTYVGGDSAVHLSEELSHASHALPRAMVWAAIANYATGFVMTVSFMSNLGDLDADLASTTGQPWVAVIQNVTGSKAATIVIVVVMIFMVTTSSRQVWAFSRDRGLPFSSIFARVNPVTGVPTNAVYLTLVFTSLLALIIIGSTTAFNIILSVSSTGLFTSYIVVISTVLVKRLRREEFPSSNFSLGYFWGGVVNVLALCFLVVAFVFLFFPAAPSPDPKSMNWAVLIYGVVLSFAAIYYWIYGWKEYRGPVRDVKWQAGEDRVDLVHE